MFNRDHRLLKLFERTRTCPKAKLQRCTFHVFFQVKRYTTGSPKTIAGMELYMIAKDLLMIKDLGQAANW